MPYNARTVCVLIPAMSVSLASAMIEMESEEDLSPLSAATVDDYTYVPKGYIRRCGDVFRDTRRPPRFKPKRTYHFQVDYDDLHQDLLHVTAKINDLKAVKIIVAQGANINWQDETGRSALHYAAKEGHIEVVNFLLTNGADVNVVDSKRRHRPALCSRSQSRFV